MSPKEFFKTHAENMQGDVPFVSLPFFRWLAGESNPPNRFASALLSYYNGHEVKGAFSDAELDSYRHIYNEFWRQRHAAADYEQNPIGNGNR